MRTVLTSYALRIDAQEAAEKSGAKDSHGTDLIRAIPQHPTVFGLLAAELTTLPVGVSGKRLTPLLRVDLGYGVVAGQVIVVGLLLVFCGALMLMGLLSAPPTIAIIGSRKQAGISADFGRQPLQ